MTGTHGDGKNARWRLSTVMPVLGEAADIVAALRALAPPRAQGHEVIVVDGGSRDGTPALAAPWGDRVLAGPRGRARQKNAGAALASGDVPLFLHADTVLPAAAASSLRAARKAGALWGRFDVRIVGASAWFPVIAARMNVRSRLTGIATGEQALFVQAALFHRLGGCADPPLMEDVELSHRLRDIAALACLMERVLTSGRRWETRGVWRTTFLRWRLRWAHWRGASSEVLARAYQ